MDVPGRRHYVALMSRIRPPWRLLIMSILLLGGVAIGVSVALPGSRDTAAAVYPYDPMPRW